MDFVKVSSREAPKQRRLKTPTERYRVAYKDRPFIAWDGEGEGGSDGTPSHYILFGASTGDTVSSRKLRATECFELLVRVGKEHPNAIHVFFSGNYDVTMMMASLPDEKQTQLAKEGKTYFRQYRIVFMPKKWFEITDREMGVKVKVFDIFTFFACSAMRAWEEYLGDDPRLVTVKEGKDKRSGFTYGDIDYIRSYMGLELELYVALVTKLRLLLSELDVHPTGWYGPGAVSGAVMKKFGIKKAMDKELPSEIVKASQHAYFGGRFEQFKTGKYVGDVYSYDIRSAYPHALRLVPNLQKGFWNYRECSGIGNAVVQLTEEVPDFSLWHVRYRKREDPATTFLTPSPFPYRDRSHAVHYPNRVEGWYWGTEAKAAIRTSAVGDVEVVGIWEFVEHDSNDRPFGFLEELYEQRAKWKREGNPVQLAAKLVLNSIYGKLAQRVGWDEEKNTSPTWHQLEWAGFAVATCRAAIGGAIAQSPGHVIAVETDGIYTTTPLVFPPDTGKLGDWESERFDGIIYVQSGVYWIRKDLGYDDSYNWNKVRIRGFGAGDIDRDVVERGLEELSPLTAHTRRFAAITGFHGTQTMTQWLEKHPVIEWGGGGKRIHNDVLCGKCRGTEQQLHDLMIHYPQGGYSHKHVLPWLDEEPNPYWGGDEDDEYSSARDSALWSRTDVEDTQQQTEGKRRSLVRALRDAAQGASPVRLAGGALPGRRVSLRPVHGH